MHPLAFKLILTLLLLQTEFLRLFRHVALAPCYALGFCSDTSTVEMVLFDSYTEREDAPLAEFRAYLSSRSGGTAAAAAAAAESTAAGGGFLPPPAVYQAHVRIDLQMGGWLGGWVVGWVGGWVGGLHFTAWRTIALLSRRSAFQ